MNLQSPHLNYEPPITPSESRTLTSTFKFINLTPFISTNTKHITPTPFYPPPSSIPLIITLLNNSHSESPLRFVETHSGDLSIQETVSLPIIPLSFSITFNHSMARIAQRIALVAHGPSISILLVRYDE